MLHGRVTASATLYCVTTHELSRHLCTALVALNSHPCYCCSKWNSVASRRSSRKLSLWSVRCCLISNSWWHTLLANHPRHAAYWSKEAQPIDHQVGYAEQCIVLVIRWQAARTSVIRWTFNLFWMESNSRRTRTTRILVLILSHHPLVIVSARRLWNGHCCWRDSHSIRFRCLVDTFVILSVLLSMISKLNREIVNGNGFIPCNVLWIRWITGEYNRQSLSRRGTNFCHNLLWNWMPPNWVSAFEVKCIILAMFCYLLCCILLFVYFFIWNLILINT